MIRPLVVAIFTVIAVLEAQNAPLSIVLLIDVSASVSDAMATLAVSRDQDGDLHGVTGPTSPRDLFARAIEDGFIANLSPTDRVRFGTIARNVRLSPAFTTDRAVLRQEVTGMLDVPAEMRYGPSPLWDAVDAAVTALGSEPGRRAIVLVTDGLSTGNNVGLDAVIAHATKSDVRVSVVGEWFGLPRPYRFSFRGGVGLRDNTRWPWRQMVWPFGIPPDVNLRRLATSTGGVFVADGAPPADRWAECGTHLRSKVPQCAGEDPMPALALAAVLKHLHPNTTNRLPDE